MKSGRPRRLALVWTILGALSAPALHALDITCKLERMNLSNFLFPDMGIVNAGYFTQVILLSPYPDGQTTWTWTPADGRPAQTLETKSSTLVLPLARTTPGVYYAASTSPSEAFSRSRTVTITPERAPMPLTVVSNRVYLAANQPPPITGFVVDQPGPTSYPSGTSRYMLVRAVGPTLANYGITGTLAAPRVEIYNAAGCRMLPVTAFTHYDPSFFRQLIATAVSAVGAFPLLENGDEFATVYRLPAGSFSAVLSSNQPNATGTALIEIWSLPSFPIEPDFIPAPPGRQ